MKKIQSKMEINVEELEEHASRDISMTKAIGAKRINISHRKITIEIPRRHKPATGEDCNFIRLGLYDEGHTFNQ